MNWKVFLLLSIILFASAITTIAIGLKTPKVSRFSISERAVLNTGFTEPLGDPVDGPGFPL